MNGLRDAGVLANDTGAEIAALTFLAPLRGPDGLEITVVQVPTEGE
jgi:hypothetical protein